MSEASRAREKESRPNITLAGLVCGTNQGVTLAATLASLAECDEIIYVDGGSTDGSREMAENAGCKVIRGDELKLSGGSQFRNAGADAATTDWIAWLSCDDVLELGGVRKIKNGIAANPDVPVLNPVVIEGQHLGLSHRVFKKGVKFHGRSHEYPLVEISRNIDAKIEHRRGPWHDNPTNPNAILEATWQDMLEDPDNPRWVYYHAREHWFRKDWPAAAYYFERCVKMKGGHLPEKADAWLYLARCKTMTMDVEGAAVACLNAIGLNANFKEALHFMATCTPAGNSERWAQMAETADNRGVLFVRAIPEPIAAPPRKATEAAG